MRKPIVFAKKAFVLAAFAGSLLFGGSSPKGVDAAKAYASCPNNGSPCVNLDCSYWQCCIDQTYANTNGDRCQAVMMTYAGMVAGCPAVAQCNLYLYGCNK